MKQVWPWSQAGWGCRGRQLCDSNVLWACAVSYNWTQWTGSSLACCHLNWAPPAVPAYSAYWRHGRKHQNTKRNGQKHISFTSTVHVISTAQIGECALKCFREGVIKKRLPENMIKVRRQTWQGRKAAGCRRCEGSGGSGVQPVPPQSPHSGCSLSDRAPGVCWGSPLIGCWEEYFPGYWQIHLSILSYEQIKIKTKTEKQIQRRTSIFENFENFYVFVFFFQGRAVNIIKAFSTF